MKYVIKKHIIAFVIAVVIGIITGLPQLIAIQSMSNWAGIFPTVNDDEVYYQARGQEIADGHYFLTNPYLYEYKDASPMQFWLPDFFVAMPLAVFDIPVQIGYVAYDFLLPITLALLSYIIIFTLTKSRQLSLVGMIVIHIGLFLHLFNRGPSPQFIFIFWQLVTLLFLRFELYKKKIDGVLLSIVFGLLFYIYPYYWTYYVIFFLLYLSTRFLLGKRDITSYLYIFLGSAIISIPYFVSYIRSTQLPYYAESVVRLGLLETHFPSGYMIVIPGIFLLILFFIVFKKKRNILQTVQFTFLLAGVMACVVAVNHHVITGKNLEFSSHYYPLSMVFFVYAATYVYSEWVKGFSQRTQVRFITIVMLLVLPWSIVRAQEIVSDQMTPSELEIEQQRYAPVLQWIDINTKPDAVVFANQSISALLPAYTHANVFYAREANLFFLPDHEVEERFILNNYWTDFTDTFIRKNERAIWGTQYINAYGHIESRNKILRMLGVSEIDHERLPEAAREKIKKKAKTIQNKSLQEQLLSYRVDYILIDRKYDTWKLEDFGEVTQLFAYGDIVVYSYDN